jgi:hypothetical protein
MKTEGSGSASGSGSISQRHGSADPDPYQNVIDPHDNEPNIMITRRGCPRFSESVVYSLKFSLMKLTLIRSMVFHFTMQIWTLRHSEFSNF